MDGAHGVPPVEGRLEAIYIKRVRKGPMDGVERAELVTGRGLAGNANHGGRRQVTVLSRDAWLAMMAELGTDLPPSARRANLLVSGIDLAHTRGQLLLIGDTVLEVAGETRPCERMDEAAAGLRAAMSPEWRGGVFGRVLRGGPIRVGDRVLLQQSNGDLFDGTAEP